MDGDCWLHLVLVKVLKEMILPRCADGWRLKVRTDRCLDIRRLNRMSYVGLLVSPPGGDGQLVEVVSPQC